MDGMNIFNIAGFGVNRFHLHRRNFESLNNEMSYFNKLRRFEVSVVLFHIFSLMSLFSLAIILRFPNRAETLNLSRRLLDEENNYDQLSKSQKYEILSKLIEESFGGNWTINNTFGNLNNNHGLCQMLFKKIKRFKGKEGEFFNYDLFFFDGKYNNYTLYISNSFPFKYEDEYPLFYYTTNNTEFSNYTSIINNNDINTKIIQNQKTLIFSNKDMCSVSKINNLKMDKNTIAKANVTFQIEMNNFSQINGKIELENVSIKFHLINNKKFFYGDIYSLIVGVSLIGLVQAYLFIQLNKQIDADPSIAINYSPYLFLVNNIFNSFVSFECFLGTLYNDKLFNYFLTPTIIYFVTSCLLEIKVVFSIFKEHIQRRWDDNFVRISVIKKRIVTFFILFYITFILLIFYSHDLFFSKISNYIIASLTFLPQILYNLRSFQKKHISFSIVICLFLNVFFFNSFFRIKQNFLYFEQDLLYCNIIFILLISEIVALVFSNYIKLTKFISKIFKKRSYNYFYSISDLKKKKVELNNKICAICLCSFIKGNSTIIESQPNIKDLQLKTDNINSEDINNEINNNGVNINNKVIKQREKVSLKSETNDNNNNNSININVNNDMQQNNQNKPNKKCRFCPFKNKETDDEIIMLTPCMHLFHSDCLQQWMKQKNTCPDCRATLPELI